MYPVSITLDESFPIKRDALFRFIVAEDVLPKVLTGYGPVPAVVATRNVSGPWDLPGSWRTVVLADGGTAREEVAAFELDDYFAYRVSDFTFPIRHLANEARGQWWFTEERPGTTQVKWTYTFYAKNAWARLPLWAFAHSFWRGYMQVCFDRTRKIML